MFGNAKKRPNTGNEPKLGNPTQGFDFSQPKSPFSSTNTGKFTFGASQTLATPQLGQPKVSSLEDKLKNLKCNLSDIQVDPISTEEIDNNIQKANELSNTIFIQPPENLQESLNEAFSFLNKETSGTPKTTTGLAVLTKAINKKKQNDDYDKNLDTKLNTNFDKLKEESKTKIDKESKKKYPAAYLPENPNKEEFNWIQYKKQFFDYYFVKENTSCNMVNYSVNMIEYYNNRIKQVEQILTDLTSNTDQLVVNAIKIKGYQSLNLEKLKGNNNWDEKTMKLLNKNTGSGIPESMKNDFESRKKTITYNVLIEDYTRLKNELQKIVDGANTTECDDVRSINLKALSRKKNKLTGLSSGNTTKINSKREEFIKKGLAKLGLQAGGDDGDGDIKENLSSYAYRLYDNYQRSVLDELRIIIRFSPAFTFEPNTRYSLLNELNAYDSQNLILPNLLGGGKKTKKNQKQTGGYGTKKTHYGEKAVKGALSKFFGIFFPIGKESKKEEVLEDIDDCIEQVFDDNIVLKKKLVSEEGSASVSVQNKPIDSYNRKIFTGLKYGNKFDDKIIQFIHGEIVLNILAVLITKHNIKIKDNISEISDYTKKVFDDVDKTLNFDLTKETQQYCHNLVVETNNLLGLSINETCGKIKLDTDEDNFFENILEEFKNKLKIKGDTSLDVSTKDKSFAKFKSNREINRNIKAENDKKAAAQKAEEERLEELKKQDQKRIDQIDELIGDLNKKINDKSKDEVITDQLKSITKSINDIKQPDNYVELQKKNLKRKEAELQELINTYTQKCSETKENIRQQKAMENNEIINERVQELFSIYRNITENELNNKIRKKNLEVNRNLEELGEEYPEKLLLKRMDELIDKNIVKKNLRNFIKKCDNLDSIPSWRLLLCETINGYCSLVNKGKGGKPTVVMPSFDHFNIVLMGTPGVGKSFTARSVGEALESSGLLTSGKFTPIIKSDLIGQYTGQTAPKVYKSLTDSLGKTVLLDEAYSIAGSKKNDGQYDSFGQEAIDAITEFATNHIGLLSIVAAGYKYEMETQFLEVNIGLPRRFPKRSQLDLLRYSLGGMWNIYKYNACKSFIEGLFYSFNNHHRACFEIMNILFNYQCNPHPKIIGSENLFTSPEGQEPLWRRGTLNSASLKIVIDDQEISYLKINKNTRQLELDSSNPESLMYKIKAIYEKNEETRTFLFLYMLYINTGIKNGDLFRSQADNMTKLSTAVTQNIINDPNEKKPEKLTTDQKLSMSGLADSRGVITKEENENFIFENICGEVYPFHKDIPKRWYPFVEDSYLRLYIENNPNGEINTIKLENKPLLKADPNSEDNTDLIYKMTMNTEELNDINFDDLLENDEQKNIFNLSEGYERVFIQFLLATKKESQLFASKKESKFDQNSWWFFSKNDMEKINETLDINSILSFFKKNEEDVAKLKNYEKIRIENLKKLVFKRGKYLLKQEEESKDDTKRQQEDADYLTNIWKNPEFHEEYNPLDTLFSMDDFVIQSSEESPLVSIIKEGKKKTQAQQLSNTIQILQLLQLLEKEISYFDLETLIDSLGEENVNDILALNIFSLNATDKSGRKGRLKKSKITEGESESFKTKINGLIESKKEVLARLNIQYKPFNRKIFSQNFKKKIAREKLAQTPELETINEDEVLPDKIDKLVELYNKINTITHENTDPVSEIINIINDQQGISNNVKYEMFEFLNIFASFFILADQSLMDKDITLQINKDKRKLIELNMYEKMMEKAGEEQDSFNYNDDVKDILLIFRDTLPNFNKYLDIFSYRLIDKDESKKDTILANYNKLRIVEVRPAVEAESTAEAGGGKKSLKKRRYGSKKASKRKFKRYINFQ